MSHHYLFSATGHDKPGIVAAVTQHLFQQGFNLEDSAMMRLGSEFGIFLIFSSAKIVAIDAVRRRLAPVEKKFQLNISLKPLQGKLSVTAGKQAYLVTVHGLDKPGIVFHVTQLLAQAKFNISDLSTHRTTSGPRPGYILFIEGELPTKTVVSTLQKKLTRVGHRLHTKIQLQPIPLTSL